MPFGRTLTLLSGAGISVGSPQALTTLPSASYSTTGGDGTDVVVRCHAASAHLAGHPLVTGDGGQRLRPGGVDAEPWRSRTLARLRLVRYRDPESGCEQAGQQYAGGQLCNSHWTSFLVHAGARMMTED